MRASEFITEKWSNKYKRSINCANPKGFSQRAHCQGRNKNEDTNVEEAFDKSYPLTWEKGDFGDIDAHTTLPDGTPLSIMFNKEDNGLWFVEFYRSQTQDLSGEGDAQRIFATVLGAIQKFVKKVKPKQISFSAVKENDPSGSRSSLYDRLVQRYASGLGYSVERHEAVNKVSYDLISNVKENFADNGNPVKFTVTSPDGYKHSFQITLAVHGKHVGHFNFVRGADTDDVNNEAEVESRWQGQGYGKLLLMKAIDVANSHGLDFQQDIRGITDAQQNVYDSLENAGLIVTPGDGFWFLTPQGEQELTGLNENFADGEKPGRKGLAKRVGVNCKQPVSKLRSIAAHSSGEKQRMAHWCANMKSGHKKGN